MELLQIIIQRGIFNKSPPLLFYLIHDNTKKQPSVIEYERYINRSGDEEIMNRWQSKNGVTITKKEDMDIDSFKKAVEGVDEWFVEQLKDAGYDDGQELVDLFEK